MALQDEDQELTDGDILPEFRCGVAEFFFMPKEANGNATPPASP